MTYILYYAPNGTGLSYQFTDASMKKITGYYTFSWTLGASTPLDSNIIYIGSQSFTFTQTGTTLVEHLKIQTPNYTAIDSIQSGLVRGLIFDQNGNVMSGATVNDGTSNAQTNIYGTYGFSGLKSGNLTLTPSLAKYTFTPTSSTANGAGAINVDFQASPATSGGGTVTCYAVLPDSILCLVCYRAKIKLVDTLGKVFSVLDDETGSIKVAASGIRPGGTAQFTFPAADSTRYIQFYLAAPDPVSDTLVTMMNMYLGIYVPAGSSTIQVQGFVCK
jgi:hypothetical protein